MSRFFIGRPIVAIVIAIVTVLGGLVAMRGLPIAQFPQIVPPQIIVTDARTPAPTRVTIEQSVATPLEQQMNGVDNMLYMQSTNANDGTMTLTVTFDVETDVNIDQVNVAEPHGPGAAQPAAGREPVRPHDRGSRRACRCWSSSLYSPKRHATTRCSSPTTRTSTSTTRSIACPGVGEVRIFGAGDYAMRIWVKPDVLAQARPHRPGSVRARPAAEHRQSRRARSAREPAPPGQEMTYTVRAQGRLADAGGVRQRSSCARTRTARSCACKDVARIELGALNYQQIGRVQRPARLPSIAVFQTPGLERARRGRRRQEDDGGAASSASRATSTTQISLDTTLPVTEGIREIVDHARSRRWSSSSSSSSCSCRTGARRSSR